MDQMLVIPGITDPVTLTCIARSRKFGQYIKAVENALAGICPFYQVDRSYNQIVAENPYWLAWPCKPPEDNTRLHFLFVPKKHVTDTSQLSDEQTLALWGKRGIRRIVQVMYEYTSRGTLIRDGDATLSAGTVQHLHVHDMVPNGTGRVESPFFKGIDSEKECVQRAIVFEKLRTGMPEKNLTQEEILLITPKKK